MKAISKNLPLTYNGAVRIMATDYEKRFWAQVDKLGNCWRWTGTLNNKGYGVFYAKVGRTKFWKAHAYSWYLHNGINLGSLFILHTCDNPWCVNPDHLWRGTNQDNMEDKIAKDRHNKGITHGRAKLTEDDVYAIRESDETNEVLGAKYGVHPAHISNIQTGKAWSHLPADRKQ